MRVLSVILPTYNESKNVPILIEKIGAALAGIDYEVLVVDDNSPDRTYEIVDNISKTNPRVRCIRRIHERGLSSAVVTGMSASEAQYFAVMDADLQHDESILPDLLRAVREEGYDLAVGSRAAEDGSFGEWSRVRRFMSWSATLMAKILLPVQVKDPMSGFFLTSRGVFEKARDQINPVGFKILLEFLGRLRGLKVKEVGYTFRTRIHGETKLSGSVIRNYLVALLDLRFGHVASPVFILYCLVGASGVIVYYAVRALTDHIMISFLDTGLAPPFARIPAGAILAFIFSVTNNYAWNNYLTFYDIRHKGFRIATGVILFFLVSLVGLLVQTAVTHLIHTLGMPADAASAAFARAAGISVAVITNYFLNVTFTWRARRIA